MKKIGSTKHLHTITKVCLRLLRLEQEKTRLFYVKKIFKYSVIALKINIKNFSEKTPTYDIFVS